MKNKKGIGLNEAVVAVTVIVSVAFLVIVGIYLFSIMSTVSPLKTESTNSESVTMNGPAVTNVANYTACGFQGFTVSSVTNSSGYTLNSANYTSNSTGIANLTFHEGNPWVINYTYQWRESSCTASQTIITQFGAYPALVGLVGTIVFLAIVIGVLVSSFVFRSRRGA